MAYDITSKRIIKKSLGESLYTTLRKGLFDQKWCIDGAIFYAEPKTAGAMRIVKLGTALYDKFKLTYKKDIDLKGVENSLNRHITWEVSGEKFSKFRVESTGKSSGGGTQVTTPMQEEASMWIIRRALKRDEAFKTWADVAKDKDYPKLLEIFPTIEDEQEWKKSFMAQNKVMLRVAAKQGYEEFKEYARPQKGVNNFASWMDTQLRKFPKYNLGQWNPADIWLVRNPTNVKRDISKVLDKMTSPNVLMLNKVMKKLFKNERLIPISLKKVTGEKAHWATHNLVEMSIDKRKEYDMVLHSAKCMCNIKGTKGKERLATKEGRMYQYEGTNEMYQWQITSNGGSSNYSNLKYEASGSSSKAARAGKAVVDRVQETLTNYKKGGYAPNDHSKYPKSADEFGRGPKQGQYDIWHKRFKVIEKAGVKTGVKNADEFCSNIIKSFDSQGKMGGEQKGVTTTKLMVIAFMCAVYGIKKKKDRSVFMVELLLHAMKKGFHYGPFGKLY